MNEKFNESAKVEQLTNIFLSRGEEKALSLKILICFMKQKVKSDKILFSLTKLWSISTAPIRVILLLSVCMLCNFLFISLLVKKLIISLCLLACLLVVPIVLQILFWP